MQSDRLPDGKKEAPSPEKNKDHNPDNSNPQNQTEKYNFKIGVTNILTVLGILVAGFCILKYFILPLANHIAGTLISFAVFMVIVIILYFVVTVLSKK